MATNVIPFYKSKDYCFCFWKSVNFSIFLYVLPFVSCPVMGQAWHKNIFSGIDVSKWGELVIGSTSTDKTWISYKMQYQSTDTLFIKNIKNHKIYVFPHTQRAEFSVDNNIICKNNENKFYFLNLNSGQLYIFKNVLEMKYSSSLNQLILLEDSNILKLIDLKNGNEKKIPDVVSFSLSPNQKTIAFVKSADMHKKSIELLNISNPLSSRRINDNFYSNINQLTWSSLSDGFCFIGELISGTENKVLNFYNIKKKLSFELNPIKRNDFPLDKFINANSKYLLRISSDLTKVFFCLSQKRDSVQQNNYIPEIWHTNDKFIYPFEKYRGKANENLVAVWHPENDNFSTLSSAEFPKITLTGNDNFAIISNPKAYEPQPKKEGNRDYFTINCNTYEKTLIVKNQNPGSAYLLTSPSGKFITYFKDYHWWLYDISTKKLTNLTYSINQSFFDKEGSPFGVAGWTADDKEIILYDQYDLWLINSTNKTFKCLTAGREKKIKFRLATLNELDSYDFVYDGIKPKVIDLESKLILRADGDDLKSGYFKWSKKDGQSPVIYRDSFINKMHFSYSSELYVYQEQKFNLPPRLIVKEARKVEKVLYQSNTQYEKFNWSKSELIYYQNSKGKKLKAILFYPFNYNQNKKYPMIVNIYEIQSKKTHFFYNPNLLSSNGFNPEVLCSNGYFVLAPDIEHENGNIGDNATDCTVSAVKEIVNRGLVDHKKIGLMGHSFGGYETNIILTKTNIFAAAVSGSSISDIQSAYLTVEEESGIPFAVRFQKNGQWRMGKTLFEEPNLYVNNSPVLNAIYITTPLLLWTGKEDTHVHWYQTVNLYMALRILEKKATMLLYHKEHHDLQKQENRNDLSTKILDWFDHNLKGKNPSYWISNSLIE